MTRPAATIAVVLLAWQTAAGALRFPPPEFESDYTMPEATRPEPGERPTLYPLPTSSPFATRYLDAVLLSATVALGVYVVLKKGPLHAPLALAGIVAIYLGLWDGLCRYAVTLAGADPGATAERVLNLATPLIVLAAVLAGSIWKRSRHGIVLAVLLAGLHAGIWWDGLYGSWGVIRRVAWLFGAGRVRLAFPFPYEYLDVVLLAAGILVAAYLALKVRSRHGIIVVMIFCLLHFGFWRQGCICPIGAIQTVARGIFDRSYPISPIVVLFFVLPVLGALWMGRSFCAAVCPLGAIQDVVIVRPVRVPPWLAHGLRMLAWLYLGLAVLLAAVGSAFIICEYDPFVALFRLEGSTHMLLLGGCFLVLGLFVARPYCRFLCPLGAIFRATSAVSWKGVTITPAECVRCGLCEDACPFGAIRPANVDDPPRRRGAGKGALAALLAGLPVLVAGSAWLGGALVPPLARTHEMVRLAERIADEQAGRVEGETDATAALKAMDASARNERYRQIRDEAARVEGRFVVGGRILGGFLGAVFGLKLIGLMVHRRREDYEADAATCLSCGRCFAYCPIEHRRRKENG